MLSLIACGGGGGDAGTPALPAAGALALSSSNYVAAVQAVLGASAYLEDSGRLVVAAQTSQTGASLRAALAQVEGVAARFARVPKLVAGAVSSATEGCTGGGVVNITANDANGNNSLDVGDSLSLSFVGCIESGVTLNGGIDITISALTGVFESSNYSATLAMAIKSLSAADATGTETGNGQLTLKLSASGVYDESQTLDVPSFSTSGTLGGVAQSTTLSAYVLTLARAPGGTRYIDRVSISGGLAGSALDGKSVTVSTATPITVDWNALLPRAGQLFIKGAAGSQVRATVQSSGAVLLELDADGNGSYELSTTKSWSELGG